MFNGKKVKIVSTLGPASKSPEMLEKLFNAGVNVFRLNFSHGSYEDHKENFDNIRKLEKKLNKPIAILGDLQGPKLRVGKFKEDKVLLEVGQSFVLDMKNELGDNTRVTLPHPQIFNAVKKGSFLLIDDGKIRLQVEDFTSEYMVTKVLVGGYISNAKGVNFPSGILKISALTEKDLKDLNFMMEIGVDFVALSFVQLPEDVEHAKSIIKGRAKVISKIEKPSAVENISAIIDASDGIMVARGDLGVEVPIHTVPVIQKKIVKECRMKSKPVIVATQMLDSMINSPMPTRAEASDVANAVYDGADCVMLSAETTVGMYPEETVTVMSDIIKSVQGDETYWKIMETSNMKSDVLDNLSESVASSVGHISKEINAKYIVAFSATGATINRVSRERPKAEIIAITNNYQLYNQSAINWGVKSLFVDSINSFSEVVDFIETYLTKEKLVVAGDRIVVVAGIPFNVGGVTNSIRVIEIK
jgi:pyruvate kinase